MDLLFDGEKAYIVGSVKAIFFENPTNFYKVLLIQLTETNTDFLEKEIVVTGSFGQIQEEELYRFYGHFVDHPRYGRQFQVDSYQKEKPTSMNGVINYLSSDKFPGIGRRTAEKIVEVIGKDTIDQIIAHPETLKQVPNLNEKKRQVIIEGIQLNHGMEQIIVGLNQYGFGNQLSFTIYQVYKEETLEVIKKNPYQLVEDIEGIGFKRADAIADQLGMTADATTRIQAAILHVLFQQSIQTGNTYVKAEILLEETIELLEKSRPIEISHDQVAAQIIELVQKGKIQQETTELFNNSLYFAEWGIGTSIQRLLAQKKETTYEAAKIKDSLRLLEKQLNISYGKIQQKAIKLAIKSPLFILTGGPGTGKTTVINGIVSLFAELNGISLDLKDYTQKTFPILLAAPTGRAAKRMNEMTGLPASTIHRLLGLTGREKNPGITAKELEGGLLIIDEMSMVDTWLANTLFKNIPTNMQVILVGDKDQIPSVGPGQVFYDLLQVDEIPKIELTKIYRQETDSSIIELAHEIKQGKLPENLTINQKDRSFFRSDAFHIEHYIKQIISKATAKGFTAQDIQVLAPMYRGAAGINALNKMMQGIFNPADGKKKEVTFGETTYRIGDKVLQLVNMPETNVFNGDMGEIVGIVPAKESDDKVDELVIQFDTNEVSYKRNEWNKITLSYCCSIHKAQGSEFKMVILPMIHQYNRMLQRNLLYTAITRSKELLILLGEPEAFQQCVENEAATRLTRLKECIQRADTMTVSERLKLEAFEESLVNSSPFGEKQVTDNKNDIEFTKNANKSANKLLTKETLTQPKSEVETISLFSEPSESKIQESKPHLLTMALIQANTIDPMIGMDGITPDQFVKN